MNVHLRPTEVEKELDYYKGIHFLLEGSVCIQSSESDAETGPAESESHSKGGNTSTALPSDDESEDIEAARDNAFSRILPPTSAPTTPGASLTGHGINTVCCFLYFPCIFFLCVIFLESGVHVLICRKR